MKRSTFITWADLKVGALILVALLIMTFGMYKLGQAANLFTKRYDLITFLPNANGLRVGGAVAISGQPVGTIKKHATGRGNAGKDEVIAAMRAKGHPVTDDNEADALALLHWAIDTQEA